MLICMLLFDLQASYLNTNYKIYAYKIAYVRISRSQKFVRSLLTFYITKSFLSTFVKKNVICLFLYSIFLFFYIPTTFETFLVSDFFFHKMYIFVYNISLLFIGFSPFIYLFFCFLQVFQFYFHFVGYVFQMFSFSSPKIFSFYFLFIYFLYKLTYTLSLFCMQLQTLV